MVCYGWAVGQSQRSGIEHSPAALTLTFDRLPHNIKIFLAPHRWSSLELFTINFSLFSSLPFIRRAVWHVEYYKSIITTAHRLIHALHLFLFRLLWIRQHWIGFLVEGSVGGGLEWRQQRGRICPLRSVWMYTSSPGEASLGASRLLNTPIFGICRGWTGD